MLIRKSRRLCRTEEATLRTCLLQLQAEGIDVEIGEDWQDNSRALDIVLAGPAESAVFESLTGGVYYAILVRLIAERSGLTLTEWGLATSYDDQIAPASFADSDPLWSLGGQLYRPCEVLNSRIEKNQVLKKGQIVEGWLLSSGVAPIPAEYGKSAVVPFRLTLWDQSGNEIAADGALSVLRRADRDNIRVRKGTGLYGDATCKPSELPVAEQGSAPISQVARPGETGEAAKDS